MAQTTEISGLQQFFAHGVDSFFIEIQSENLSCCFLKSLRFLLKFLFVICAFLSLFRFVGVEKNWQNYVGEVLLLLKELYKKDPENDIQRMKAGAQTILLAA